MTDEEQLELFVKHYTQAAENIEAILAQYPKRKIPSMWGPYPERKIALAQQPDSRVTPSQPHGAA